VVLIRRDAARSRSIGLTAGLQTLVILGAITIAAVFVFVGSRLESRAADRRTAELNKNIAKLTEENTKVARLAGRLRRIEDEYMRLRRAMGGEIEPSGRDVVLPSLGAERDGGRKTEENRDGARVPAVWPIVELGFVTRSFGDSLSGDGVAHQGTDIAVPTGSYVRASGGGKVRAAGEDSVYGLFVRIDHDGGWSSLYAHNSFLFVRAGDSVETADVIALSGNTGRSSAPHLHFEIERNGRAIDPRSLIPSDR